MKTTKLIYNFPLRGALEELIHWRSLAVLLLLLCLPFAANAQVKIGDDAAPTPGAVLDLKKTSDAAYIGGVLLPHVEIKDLRYIPAAFTGASDMTGYDATNGVDTNTALAGMVVYNSVAVTNIPKGVYVWRGTDWQNIYYPEINGGGHIRDNNTELKKVLPTHMLADDDGECGAYIHNGRWLRFMCHNLGAQTSLNPLGTTAKPAGLHGAKYRFGAKEASLTMEKDQATAGAVSGWTTSSTAEYPFQATGDWSAANNPCPDGWRLPTHDEWDQLKFTRNNSREYLGTWTSGSYTSGIKIGNRLFLPATGYRRTSDGTLINQGTHGYYWGSNQSGSSGDGFYFYNGSLGPSIEGRSAGYSVRCVAEDRAETNPPYVRNQVIKVPELPVKNY